MQQTYLTAKKIKSNSTNFFCLTQPDFGLTQNFGESLGGIAEKTPKK